LPFISNKERTRRDIRPKYRSLPMTDDEYTGTN